MDLNFFIAVLGLLIIEGSLVYSFVQPDQTSQARIVTAASSLSLLSNATSDYSSGTFNSSETRSNASINSLQMSRPACSDPVGNQFDPTSCSRTQDSIASYLESLGTERLTVGKRGQGIWTVASPARFLDREYFLIRNLIQPITSYRMITIHASTSSNGNTAAAGQCAIEIFITRDGQDLTAPAELNEAVASLLDCVRANPARDGTIGRFGKISHMSILIASNAPG